MWLPNLSLFFCCCFLPHTSMIPYPYSGYWSLLLSPSCNQTYTCIVSLYSMGLKFLMPVLYATVIALNESLELFLLSQRALSFWLYLSLQRRTRKTWDLWAYIWLRGKWGAEYWLILSRNSFCSQCRRWNYSLLG